jgi:predicted nucleic acid-binding protein
LNKKVYIDCNILLDWLLDREPFSYAAALVITLAESGELLCSVSALTLANTYYILKKEVNQKIAEEFLKDALKLFQIVDLSADCVKWAVTNKYKDFEDDLHYFAAIDSSMDYIITRNTKHFLQENIRVGSAEDFIDAYSEEYKK